MGLYSRLQTRFNELEGVRAMSGDNYLSKIEIAEIEISGGGKIKGFKADTGCANKDLEILPQTIETASGMHGPTESANSVNVTVLLCAL